jgi:polyphosphate glucokinase
MGNNNQKIKILSIDIGGSHIKGTILYDNGNLLMEYKSVKTPHPATFSAVINAIESLVKNFTVFDKISVGFPGYVKDGIIYTAPNLDQKTWAQVNLSEQLNALFGKPARVVNDADFLALGVVKGKGLEMLITLGTGFGTALLKDGILLPHFELAHHPITKHKSYDDYIGAKAFKLAGIKRWNRRLKKIISILKIVFNYDTLFIGGGNATNINFKLDENIVIVTNKDGIDGGSKLWQQDKI